MATLLMDHSRGDDVRYGHGKTNAFIASEFVNKYIICACWSLLVLLGFLYFSYMGKTPLNLQTFSLYLCYRGKRGL